MFARVPPAGRSRGGCAAAGPPSQPGPVKDRRAVESLTLLLGHIAQLIAYEGYDEPEYANTKAKVKHQVYSIHYCILLSITVSTMEIASKMPAAQAAFSKVAIE